MIGILVLAAAAALIAWYAWRSFRATERWTAVLEASESLAIAFLAAFVTNWAEAPWWGWWIVVLPAVASVVVAAWRWTGLGTERPPWLRSRLAVSAMLIAGCVIVALIPAG